MIWNQAVTIFAANRMKQTPWSLYVVVDRQEYSNGDQGLPWLTEQTTERKTGPKVLSSYDR